MLAMLPSTRKHGGRSAAAQAARAGGGGRNYSATIRRHAHQRQGIASGLYDRLIRCRVDGDRGNDAGLPWLIV